MKLTLQATDAGEGGGYQLLPPLMKVEPVLPMIMVLGMVACGSYKRCQKVVAMR